MNEKSEVWSASWTGEVAAVQAAEDHGSWTSKNTGVSYLDEGPGVGEEGTISILEGFAEDLGWDAPKAGHFPLAAGRCKVSEERWEGGQPRCRCTANSGSSHVMAR